MQDPGVETRAIALQAAATVCGEAAYTHPEVLRELVEHYLIYIRTGEWSHPIPLAER
jgi:hypothetical protein